jgi:hypothetical protein
LSCTFRIDWGRTVRGTLNLIHDLDERGVGRRNLADPIRVESAANPGDVWQSRRQPDHSR